MAGYMTYWSKEQIHKLEKAQDAGLICVIYGSHHSKMPSINTVKVGDIIYPVTLSGGTLHVMARLPVERIEPAFDYLMRELGYRFGALVPKGILLVEKTPVCTLLVTDCQTDRCEAELPPDDGTLCRVFSDQAGILPHKAHQEPQTCCASLAASSAHGSMITPRPLPPECLPLLRFGSTKSKEKPLRLDKDGKPSVVGLSALRRMSEATWQQFEALFAGEV